jgi:predicted MFS family arabinose efflux permease
MQRRTPDAVRSRVSGAFDSVLHVGMALSYVAAGPAVALLGARGVYIVGGVAAFLGVAIALPILRERATDLLRAEPRVEEATEPATLLVP